MDMRPDGDMGRSLEELLVEVDHRPETTAALEQFEMYVSWD